jgi:hypothetical protein
MEYQQIRVSRLGACPDICVGKKIAGVAQKIQFVFTPSSFESKLKFGEIWKEFGKTSKMSLI